MGAELIYSDATKLAELIRTREVSPVEVVKAHLDRIEAVNPRVNAIVTIADYVLESARAAGDEYPTGISLAVNGVGTLARPKTHVCVSRARRKDE